MIKILTFVFAVLCLQSFCQEKQCDKCDLRYLTYVNQNFKNLNEAIVERFLCSQDYSCNLNPKFVQMANKTLYEILQTRPELVVDCLERYKYLNKKYIIEQIRNPYTKQNFAIVYKKVRALSDSSQTKDQVSSSIKIAALKYKIKL
jgi:hypothetical protein